MGRRTHGLPHILISWVRTEGGRTRRPESTEPLFQALKDEDPSLVTVSREYREPVCFNTEFNVQKKQ